MAVIFCNGSFTCMCRGSGANAACLSNEPLNLPILCGIPSQNETFSPGLWFDQCTDRVRLSVSSGGTGWSAGGAMISAINQGNGGGTANAAYAYGGTTGTGNPAVTTTEEYNGSTWSSGGALPAARRLLFRGCVGTQNAGIAIFGFTAPSPAVNHCTTYEYNGTTWATGGNGAITVRNGGAFGTQNSATAAGGFSAAETNCTQEYNGTSWSGGGNLIQTRQSNFGAGTSQNSGWVAGGGCGPSFFASTEKYNGTSWSNSGAMPTTTQLAASTGTENYAIVAGGRNPTNVTGDSFLFDGYLWTSTCGLITAVACNAAGGDASEGVVFSGQNTSLNIVACTQDWNNPWNYYQLE